MQKIIDIDTPIFTKLGTPPVEGLTRRRPLHQRVHRQEHRSEVTRDCTDVGRPACPPSLTSCRARICRRRTITDSTPSNDPRHDRPAREHHLPRRRARELLGDRGVTPNCAPARRPRSTARTSRPIISEQLPLGLADLVAFPTNAEQIAAVVAAAVRHGVPSPRAARAPATTARRSRCRAASCSTCSRRAAVVEVGDGFLTAEAGATMVALEQAANKAGQQILMYPSTAQSTHRRVPRRRLGRHRLDQARLQPRRASCRRSTSSTPTPDAAARPRRGRRGAALRAQLRHGRHHRPGHDRPRAPAGLARLLRQLRHVRAGALADPRRSASSSRRRGWSRPTCRPWPTRCPTTRASRRAARASAPSSTSPPSTAATALVEAAGGRVEDVREGAQASMKISMMSYNHPIEWLQKAYPDTYFHVEVVGRRARRPHRRGARRLPRRDAAHRGRSTAARSACSPASTRAPRRSTRASTSCTRSASAATTRTSGTSTTRPTAPASSRRRTDPHGLLNPGKLRRRDRRRSTARDRCIRSSRDLVELAGPALAGDAHRRRRSSCCPTGAIEHHGPHLPLSTDCLMADLIATRRRSSAPPPSGQDVWLLPDARLHEVGRAPLGPRHHVADRRDAAADRRRHRPLDRRHPGAHGRLLQRPRRQHRAAAGGAAASCGVGSACAPSHARPACRPGDGTNGPDEHGLRHPRRPQRDVDDLAPAARPGRHDAGRAVDPRAHGRPRLHRVQRRPGALRLAERTTSARPAWSATRPARTRRGARELFERAVRTAVAAAGRDRRLRHAPAGRPAGFRADETAGRLCRDGVGAARGLAAGRRRARPTAGHPVDGRRRRRARTPARCC